jgi:hypothetical protein
MGTGDDAWGEAWDASPAKATSAADDDQAPADDARSRMVDASAVGKVATELTKHIDDLGQLLCSQDERAAGAQRSVTGGDADVAMFLLAELPRRAAALESAAAQAMSARAATEAEVARLTVRSFEHVHVLGAAFACS